MDLPAKFHEALVDTQTDWYETMVLTTVLHSPQFYTRVSNVLCVDAETGKFVPEFHKNFDNAIYKILDQYYRHMAGPKPKPMPDNFAVALLQGLASRGDLIEPEEIDDVLDRLAEVRAANTTPQVYTMASGGFSHWLTKVRTVRITEQMTASGSWTPAELLSKIQLHTRAINRTTAKRTVFEFGHGLSQQVCEVQRYGTGLINFDKAMGGGLARKESTLFVAPPSAGKTILGLQLGVQMAIDHALRVLYISTEQPHDELELRILSNFCGIRFELVKDGFNADRCLTTKVQQERYEKLMDILPQRMRFKDWKEDRSRSVLADLDIEIKTYQDTYGGLDVIILDWIGGALGQNLLNDPSQIRHIYQLTADRVSDIAGDTDLVGKDGIISIAFAQAHPSLAVNKKRVDGSTISECKSMHRNYTNGVGITALLDPAYLDAGDSGGNPIYAKIQNLYGFKGRKSTGGSTLFRREYQYQRIVDK